MMCADMFCLGEAVKALEKFDGDTSLLKKITDYLLIRKY